MEKAKNSSTIKRIISILVWLLALTAIALVVWKLYGKIDIKKADFATVIQKKAEPTIYDVYKVKSKKHNRNLYYVTINDIYCDAYRKNEYDNPHFFKVDIVFEAHNKKDAQAIESITKQTVTEIRNMVKGYPVVGIDRYELMAYIKRDIKYKMNNVLQKDAVVGVYFESFLGQ